MNALQRIVVGTWFVALAILFFYPPHVLTDGVKSLYVGHHVLWYSGEAMGPLHPDISRTALWALGLTIIAIGVFLFSETEDSSSEESDKPMSDDDISF